MKKYFAAFIFVFAVGSLIYVLLDQRGIPVSDINEDANEAETASLAETAPAPSPSVVLDKINKMSLEQRRQFYKTISDNEPYVPLADVLKELDRGLIDDELEIRLYALNRFIKSFYIYGASEPSEVFNGDETRKQIFIGMLKDKEPMIRRGAFRVLAENYRQQKGVIETLASVIPEEQDNRLEMIRNFSFAIKTHPEIATRVYIDEIKAGASVPANAVPVESAYLVSMSTNPPTEVLEPVITMLEGDYFGDPLLLKALDNYGPLAKSYIDRLKQLQAKVNERILYGRDDRGKGSSTFTKEQYANVLRKIEANG